MAAVGQASRHGPRYIELVYKGDPETYKTDGTGDVFMVVGKGITFDTGGLNLKGTGFMEDMYMDMGGSAAALGACLAVHRLGIKRNVVFIAAVAENAMDANSYKPHSIIRSHKGLTVQIGNTDAEGRLVLADALSFGQQRCKPHTVLDMATLTGACIVALGEYAAGLFSNNAALRQGLQAAADASSERLWALPIFPEHRAELRDGAGMADLSSTGAGRYGGSCTAAAFLENFIGHEPAKNARTAAPAAAAAAAAAAPFTPAWAHLDIAGPASYSKPRGFMPSGGTGFGVAVVAEYLAAAPKGKLPADETKRF
jgi:leucyl aminopeptidase